jgi:hypothetical protein
VVINIPHERFLELQQCGKIQYRTFNGNFIPYIDLKFDSVNCINGINIAPMIKSDIAENGLKYFLSSMGIKCDDVENGIKIKQSTIPVRY